MSMSAFPHGVVPAAAAGGTLALGNLASSRSIFGSGSVTVGVRTLTTGDVQEINFTGAWASQNPGVEWIDDFGGGSSSDYEVQMVVASFIGGGVFSGPALSQFHTISQTRQWTLNRETQGTSTWNGTMTIREIANTSNSVNALVLLTCTIDQL